MNFCVWPTLSIIAGLLLLGSPGSAEVLTAQVDSMTMSSHALAIDISFSNETSWSLRLARHQVSQNSVVTVIGWDADGNDNGDAMTNLDMSDVLHFKGVIAQEPGSRVRMTVSPEEKVISGVAELESGRWELSIQGSLATIRPAEDIAPAQFLNDDDEIFDEQADQTSNDRPRRWASPTNASRLRRDDENDGPKYCLVFVDVDESFVMQWRDRPNAMPTNGRIRRIARRIMDIIADAAAAWEDNFDDTRIRLAGMAIHKGLSLTDGHGSDPSKWLYNYQRWLGEDALAPDEQSRLRGAGLPRSTDVCLNLLFSHTELSGGVLGAAKMPTTSVFSMGGVCDQRIEQPPVPTIQPSLAWNIATVSTNLFGGRASHDTTVRVTTHEIGHTMGAPHTCCIGSMCTTRSSCANRDGNKCNPTDNYYLMYPTITSSKNSLTFSSCSRNKIEGVLEIQSHCFVTEEQLPPTCGLPATTTVTSTSVSSSSSTSTSTAAPTTMTSTSTSTSTSSSTSMSTSTSTTEEPCPLPINCDKKCRKMKPQRYWVGGFVQDPENPRCLTCFCADLFSRDKTKDERKRCRKACKMNPTRTKGRLRRIGDLPYKAFHCKCSKKKKKN